MGESSIEAVGTMAEAPETRQPANGGLVEAVRELWQFRELLGAFTSRNIRIRYKQAVMGFGWAVFMPILIVLSGALIRYVMARMAGGRVAGADIAAIALKGVAWAFFVGSINSAVTIISSSYNLVTKIYFPRAVMPLSAALAQGFDTVIGFAALAIALPFLGVTAHWSLLWVPLLLLLLAAITAAATLFLSCANVFFRDVKYIVQVLLTFGIFFTPVFYEPAMMGIRGARFMALNPLTPILEGLRLSVVTGHNLAVPLTTMTAGGQPIVAWSPLWLWYGAAWAVGGLVLSTIIFQRGQSAFAEYA